MASTEHRSTARARGILAYLTLTFVLAWVPAWALHLAWLDESKPLITRLLTCSLFYAVSMGWQPLVALWLVGRWFEPASTRFHGMHMVQRRYLVIAAVGPVLLSAIAGLVAWVGGVLVPPAPGSLSGHAESELALLSATPGHAIALLLAFLAALTLLWAQAYSEEVGWRGYFMPRVMQRLGAWRGLAVHGLAWGIWYAPILLLASGDPMQNALRSVGFVLTCSLLGALLGWLRLASGSTVPAVIANVVLTVAAGLPYFLQDVDVGLRGAVYGPPGWLAMGLAIALLLFIRRLRDTVEMRMTPTSLPALRIGLVEDRRSPRRDLH